MSITNNSSNMAFGRLPNFIAGETNAEDFVDYYRCQMKLGGLTETEAKMVFLGKLQFPEWAKLKTETYLTGRTFDEVSASDLMDLFKNIFGCPRNSYLEILTLLKGLQSRSNDIDDVVSLVTNALKNIDVKTIRIEELAAMIILCKYQPIESIEAMIIKKACEK
uniref:Uncharacterized protein n=1 Tax=Strongyloides venezuelensis TaxID=75913 RepID=A0A0K0EXU6_STRVS